MSFRAGGQGGGWGGGGGGGGWNNSRGGSGRGGNDPGRGGAGGGGGGGGGGWSNQSPGRGGPAYGNNSWQQGQGNRFGALQQQPQQHGGRDSNYYPGPGGGRGRGGGGGGGDKELSPEEAVRSDLQHSKPQWLLSCYSHEHGGPNDLTGDVSYEEARWSNLQDLLSHRTPLSIAADYKGALRAKQEEMNQLMARARDRRGSSLPSLGGPPIAVHNSWLAQFLGPQGPGAAATGGAGAGAAPPSRAGGFGTALQPQPAGGFGFGSQQQQPPAVAGGVALGGGVLGAPGAQPGGGGGFGQTPAFAATGFGQVAAAAPAAPALGGFGAPAAAGFGQPVGSGAPGGFGTGTPGQQPGAAMMGGFGAGGGGFGSAPGGGGGAKGSWAGQGGFGAAKSGPSQVPAVLFGQSVATAPSAHQPLGGGASPLPPLTAGTGTGGTFTASQLPLGQPAMAAAAAAAVPFPPTSALQGFGSPTGLVVSAVAPSNPAANLAAATSPFSQLPAVAQVATGAAGPAGGGAGAAAPGGGGGAGGGGGGNGEEELQAFRATAFSLGKIPETPPPPELCY